MGECQTMTHRPDTHTCVLSLAVLVQLTSSRQWSLTRLGSTWPQGTEAGG